MKARKKTNNAAAVPGATDQVAADSAMADFGFAASGAAAAAGVLTAVDEDDDDEEAPVPDDFEIDEEADDGD